MIYERDLLNKYFFLSYQTTVLIQFICLVIVFSIGFYFGKKRSEMLIKTNELPFNSEQHRQEIERVINEKRNLTTFDYVYTGLRNDNKFLEFCPNDFSDTWLIQEIPNQEITKDLKQEIKIVSSLLAKHEERHKQVKIIILVYKALSDKKATYLISLRFLNQITKYPQRLNLIDGISQI